jgi:Flp pilus assembly protein TadD
MPRPRTPKRFVAGRTTWAAWPARLFLGASLFAAAVFLPARWEVHALRFFQAVINHNAELRFNNLGIAYMDQQRPADALKAFQQATDANTRDYIPRLNQGIALLNLQRTDEARTILTEISTQHPNDPHAWYNLGLLEKSIGKIEEAAANFEHVAKIDPNDADTHYFLGSAYAELHKYPEAIAEFSTTLKLNPFHLSAEFGLAQAYRRSGETNAAQEHLARFQHLNAEKLGAPMALVYGEQGKYSRAEVITPVNNAAGQPIPVHFRDVTAEVGLKVASAGGTPTESTAKLAEYGTGACVFDYDGDGHPDIFLTNADGQGHAALYHNDGHGHFIDVSAQSGLELKNAIGCAVGDYDNDGRPDLAVSLKSGGVALFHNEGNGKFTDATERAGIHVVGGALSLTWVDYDHDGDLDLYVTRPENIKAESNPGNQLWRNNGNGTFTEWTEPTGLAAAPGGIAALPTDTNEDRAIDLIVTGPFPEPLVFLNPREGKFTTDAQRFPNRIPATVAIASLDYGKSGHIGIALTHSAAPGITLWGNDGAKKFEQLPLPELGWIRGWGVAAFDYDNDGWIDLAAVGEDASGAGKIALLRNEGPHSFRDVTAETGLDEIAVTLHHPRAIVALDDAADGEQELLITQLNAPPVLLKSEGAAKHHWLDLSFKGTNDNKSAIGTKVEILSGAEHQKFELNGVGFLGQSTPDLHIGLGPNITEAEVVRMLWPTGVVQDEIHLEGNQAHTITELDRRGSSCPIVFVWNGKKFEFLADMIGPGIVGHWTAPGQHNTPDPREYFKVDSSQVSLRNGRIEFRFLEPMEELDYLDQARLLAVDHPSNVEVYPNARFMTAPPFPEFKVIAASGAHLPVAALGAHGEDVLPQVSHRDRVYLSDFPLLPYAGFAAPHTLTLDLGDWNPKNPLRLLMDGFTDYFSASSMYAAWQAGMKTEPPSVEALLPDGPHKGQWKKVIDELGMPAGLERTMIADLTGKIPPGTRQIRLTTNLAIYWDRIRFDNSPADTLYQVYEVPLAAAQLQFRGYPQVVEGNPSAGSPINDLRYNYENVSLTGPYSRQQGNYTRYGDVKPLVEKQDNEYVIYGSGDEIAISFDPSNLPPLKSGWVRDYFIYADGFAKDMDFYAAHGDTVAPLPFHTLVPYPYPPASGAAYPADPAHLDYQLEYNTRPVSGPLTQDFQFHYSK